MAEAPDPPAAEVVSSVTVDITPHQNILTKAGSSEYSFASALAEQIDNCIQACRNTPLKDIHVNVRRIGKSRHMELSIDDSGEGMTTEEVRQFLTLGISQSDRLGQDTPHALSGHISRFGVGAKRAAFFLGDSLRVMSKSASSELVAEAELSQHTLQTVGWTAEIVQRRVAATDPEGPSWTRLVISPLTRELEGTVVGRELLEAFLEEEQVTTKLSHYYHFFLHPHLYPGVVQQPAMNIYVNGRHLKDVTTNLQHQYEQSGVSPTLFKVSLTRNRRPQTVVEVRLRYFPYCGGSETLPVPPEHLRRGVEGDLQDIPMVMRRPGLDVYWQGRLIPEAHIPQSDLEWMKRGGHKNQSIEDRWLRRVHGELFLNEHFAVTHNKMHLVLDDPLVRQLTSEPNRKLQQEFREWVLTCHQQYDQDLVVDGGQYNVAGNTTTYQSVQRGPDTLRVGHPVKCGTPHLIVGKLLELSHSGRREGRRVPDLHCSIELDSGDPHVTRLKNVSPASEADLKRFIAQQEAETPHSVLLHDPARYGPRAEYVATENPQLSFLLTLCSRRGDAVAMRAWQRLQKRNRDAAVVDVVVRRDRQVVFQCCRGDGVAVTGPDNQHLVSLSFANCWQPPADALAAYRVEVVCRWSGERLEFTTQVVAGPAVMLQVMEAPTSSVELPLGEPLPTITLSLVDAMLNMVPPTEFNPDLVRVAISAHSSGHFHLVPPAGASQPSPAESTSSLPPGGTPPDTTTPMETDAPPSPDPPGPTPVARFWSVDVVQRRIRITGLAIAGVLPEGSSRGLCGLTFQYNELPPQEVLLTLCAGPPHALDLSDLPFGDPTAHYHRNLAPLPEFFVRVRDRYGNAAVCPTADLSLEVRCPHVAPPVQTFPFTDGAEVPVASLRLAATFAGDEWRPMVAELAFAILTTRRSRATARRTATQGPRQALPFSVLPSADPAGLRLAPATLPPGTTDADGMQTLPATAGETLNLLLQVLNAEMLLLVPQASHLAVLTSAVTASWDPHRRAEPQGDAFLLPPLTAPTTVGDAEYSVTLRPGSHSAEPSLTQRRRAVPLALAFRLTVRPGEAHRLVIEGETARQLVRCGVAFVLSVRAADRHGNECPATPAALVALRLHDGEPDLAFSAEPLPDPPPGVLAQFRCVARAKLEGGQAEFVVQASPAAGPLRRTKAIFALEAGPPAHAVLEGASAAAPWVVTNLALNGGPQLTLLDLMGNLCNRMNYMIRVQAVESPLTVQPPADLRFVQGVCTVVGLGVELQHAPARDLSKVYRLDWALEGSDPDGDLPALPPLHLRVQLGTAPAGITIRGLPATCIAGATVPEVQVRVFGEDGQLYSGDVSSFIAEIDQAPYPLRPLGTGQFSLTDAPAPTTAGPHPVQLTLSYPSPIPPDFRLLTQSAELTVTDSSPAALCLEALNASRQRLAAPVACNAGTAEDRQLAASLWVQVVDVFNNVCRAAAGPVELTFEPIGRNKAALCELEPFPPLILQDGCAVTGPLVLKPNAQCKGAWRMQATYGAFQQHLRVAVSDEAKLVAERQQLNERVDVLRATKVALQGEVRQKEASRGQEQRRLVQLSPKLERSIEAVARLTSSLDLPAILQGASLPAIWEQQITVEVLRSARVPDLTSLHMALVARVAQNQTTDCRPTSGMPYSAPVQRIVGLPAAQREACGIVGVVGELLRCSDAPLAHALAAALQVPLGTVVVQTDAALECVRDRFSNVPGQLDIWSLQQVQPCTAQADAAGRIVLPVAEGATPAAGFLGYALHLVELDPSVEHLRRTVVYNALRTAMVFQTRHQALAFRRAALAAGRPCPPIVAVEGPEYLSGIGIMCFPSRGGRQPALGSLAPTGTPQHKQLVQLAAAVKALLEVKDGGYEALVDSVAALDAEIERLRNELKEVDEAQADAGAKLAALEEDTGVPRAPVPTVKLENPPRPAPDSPLPKRPRR